jgi:pentatricopeptide repeat protein
LPFVLSSNPAFILLLQTVDLLKPDMDRFHELVAALCDQKMVAGAQKVLNDMRKAGAVPLRKTYLSLLELYAREGLWRDAEALRKDMVSAGLDPNGKVRLCFGFICHAPSLSSGLLSSMGNACSSLLESVCSGRGGRTWVPWGWDPSVEIGLSVLVSFNCFGFLRVGIS